MLESGLTVACAGAGLLGGAIMQRLVESGVRLHVWNRTVERLTPVLDKGATLAETPADLARASDIVLTCVTGERAVEEIVFGPDGVASTGSADKVLLDMSTSDPEATKDMAARLREACDMGWVDAPISGGAPAALKGAMTVMAGAEEADFARVQPVMRHLAGRCTRMGPVGAGQATKMINQTLVACTVAVLAEATALAQRAGVDALQIPAALAGGRADSRLLQEFMPKMATPDFTPEGSNKNMVKDLEMIHALAAATGTVMPVTALVGELYRQLVLRGRAEDCISTFVTLYQDSA